MATTTRILNANVNGTVYTANANDALEALDTCHSGATAPTDEVANGKLWLDTSTTPGTLKIYNNATWEVVLTATGTSQVKLDGIEALADVTDTANVTAAGALMDSEVTNLDQVKAFSSADYATAAQGTLADSAVQPNDTVTLGTVTATAFAGDGSALTGINTGGLTLLGTVNTTSGNTQSLTGLDLTDYVSLHIVINNVSHSLAGATTFRIAGTEMTDQFSNSVLLRGVCDIDLTHGVSAFHSTNGIKSYIILSPRHASTSIAFAMSGGNFDNGQIKVYGVK